MQRREFLTGTVLLAAGAAGTWRAAEAAVGLVGAPWRKFELTHRITLSERHGPARLWVPLPQDEGDYQRALGVEWRGDMAKAQIYRDKVYGASMLFAEWPAGTAPRSVDIVTRVATRDCGIDAPGRRREARPSREELDLYLQPTASTPIDGIVYKTAAAITVGRARPINKAQAIYDWIVANTFRDPKTRGCGLGDIKFMLESGDLSGKCADINGLFVGLARAVGLPAREFYGIRVADSVLFKSLGASDDVTKAQHCRAEVYIEGYGWTPVDPADVRKVVLEEGLPVGSPRVRELTRRLFGNWEMNWVGFNHARDFRLPAQPDGAVPFLMYPYAETAEGPLDYLDPESFRYTVQARELSI
ncbi:MAG: transglutaminase family protein [Rhodospirillales bacterium]|nr:transglutaminase family protein [Rhodospirillales bacterium]